MQILVVSDTHGDSNQFEKLIKVHNDIKPVIHLGDGEKDVVKIKENFPDKDIYSVCGNCDLEERSPEIIEINIENQKILATHGHLFKVKSSLEKLINEAEQKGANIVLYGHTHKPKTDFKNGIYIMNPGSLHRSMKCHGIFDVKKISTYGILNIEKNNISMKIFDM